MIFWKPTCPYCTRLRRSLREDREAVWVNVWVDVEANQEVRGRNRGDEYALIALVGDQVLRNPTAEDVRSALSPAGWPARPPGRRRRPPGPG